MGTAPTRNLWTRKGIFYYARVNIYNRARQYEGTIVKRLDFISYHLIRKIHGMERLNKMAMTISLARKR